LEATITMVDVANWKHNPTLALHRMLPRTKQLTN